MGTRHLIAVQIGGEYKVAQYGQWDGYPDGQGVDVLAFCRSMDRAAFAAKCRATRWITAAEIDAINDTNDWDKKFPWLSRDAGSDVLGHVMAQPDGIGLQNAIDFAGESLFCEWAYVIDLDKGTLEVYQGFNKDAVPAGERFAEAPREKEDSAYYPVRHAHTWSLDALPSDADFLSTLQPLEEEA